MTGGKRGRPAHVSLAQRIGVAIVTGERAPGSILPGEIELAESLGVSRSVIRDGMSSIVHSLSGPPGAR